MFSLKPRYLLVISTPVLCLAFLVFMFFCVVKYPDCHQLSITCYPVKFYLPRLVICLWLPWITCSWISFTFSWNKVVVFFCLLPSWFCSWVWVLFYRGWWTNSIFSLALWKSTGIQLCSQLVWQLNISPLCATALFVEFNLGKQVARDVPSGKSRLCKNNSHQRRIFHPDAAGKNFQKELQLLDLWWGCLIIKFCVSRCFWPKHFLKTKLLVRHWPDPHKGSNFLSVPHVWLKG